MGSGDGIPQHVSGGSEIRPVSDTAVGYDFYKLSFDVDIIEVQITKHYEIVSLG